jgi:hypothetical protein
MGVDSGQKDMMGGKYFEQGFLDNKMNYYMNPSNNFMGFPSLNYPQNYNFMMPGNPPK